MSKKFILSEKDLSKLIDLYVNKEMSTIKLGEMFGTSKLTINRLLKEAGVNIRKSGRYFTDFDSKRSEYYKKYREDNKEELSNYHSNWAKENRTDLNQYHSEWRETNKETVNEYKRTYEKNKKDSDPHYKFATYTRTAICETLKFKRGTGIFRYMPYSMEELITHVENLFTPGMTWDNYGEWHLDHKRPLSHFKYDSYLHPEFLECWDLNNLQPLWSTTREIEGIIYIGNLNKNNRL